MNAINQSYPNVTVSLPLQNITSWAAIEIHREMRKRRPEALRGAPKQVAAQLEEVLLVGGALHPHSTEKELKRWVLSMRQLEEVLSLFCTYDLKRWLCVFGGLRAVLEREAKKRQQRANRLSAA